MIRKGIKQPQLAGHSDQAVERLAFSIEEAMAVTGWPRNRTYDLINEGYLRTFKHGRRRYVSADALKACIQALEELTVQGRAA